MCDWWSTAQSFESEHVNRTMCHMVATNGTTSVNGIKTPNSTTGHRSCSLSGWPSCIVQSSFISGIGYSELWIDATTQLGFPPDHHSCVNNDCKFTDRFHVSSTEECATVCSRLDECKYWSVTTQENTSLVCWLRRGKYKTVDSTGSVSGDAECASSSPFQNLTLPPS